MRRHCSGCICLRAACKVSVQLCTICCCFVSPYRATTPTVYVKYSPACFCRFSLKLKLYLYSVALGDSGNILQLDQAQAGRPSASSDWRHKTQHELVGRDPSCTLEASRASPPVSSCIINVGMVGRASHVLISSLCTC